MQGDPEGEACIPKLIEALDSHLPEPVRDYSSPFLLPVESCFLVPNRGCVAIGTLVRGTIKKGDPAEVLGHGVRLKTVISDVQVSVICARGLHNFVSSCTRRLLRFFEQQSKF